MSERAKSDGQDGAHSLGAAFLGFLLGHVFALVDEGVPWHGKE